MKQTIMVYCWGSISEPMTIGAMEALGYNVVVLRKPIKDYHADAAFAREVIEAVHIHKPAMVFSYDYFPLLSDICNMNRLPYIAWIYDCPQYTLLSGTLTNDCNHIFCFDEKYAEYLQSLGAQKVYHFPLGADTNLYTVVDKTKEADYACEISFVGSLYNDEKNRLANVQLPEYTQGYVEALIQAQLKIYGYNLIKASLNVECAGDIVQACRLGLSDRYLWNEIDMAADAIGMEVTSRERQNVLRLLSTSFDVSLFTNSRLPDFLREQKRLINRGSVDYATQMPLVFHNSKINLNITSRTIECGIPQRVLDILACGGFCMTNYQPEIAELFEDGKELVMYSDMEDLLGKTEYYLEHEEERAQIAKAGREKVCEFFAIATRLQQLLECVEESVQCRKSV